MSQTLTSLNQKTTRKLLLVGDEFVGKTALSVRFKTGQFRCPAIALSAEAFEADIELDERTTVKIAVWDTSTGDEYQFLRRLYFPNTDVVALVFAVNSRTSFNNSTEIYVPEARRHLGPDIRFLLVGSKADLRANPPVVTDTEIAEVASCIGAIGYVECSAKTGDGVDIVFREAARACLEAVSSRKPHSSDAARCVVS